jgi:hypothetical protein
VNQLDKETQDVLHSLELDKLTRNDKGKLATRLRKIRQERRRNKDIVESTLPLIQFLEGEKGKQSYNLLREILGKTRKIEQYHNTRVYYKRIAKEKEIK